MNFEFSPSSTTLYIVYDNNRFCGYNCQTNGLDKWSVKNFNSIPANFKRKHNRLIGISFNPKQGGSIILYSHFYYTIIRFKEKIPKESRIVKTAEQALEMNHNFDIYYREKPILYLTNIDENNLFVIENTWT